MLSVIVKDILRAIFTHESVFGVRSNERKVVPDLVEKIHIRVGKPAPEESNQH